MLQGSEDKKGDETCGIEAYALLLRITEDNKESMMDEELANIVELILRDDSGVSEEIFQSLHDYAVTHDLHDVTNVLNSAELLHLYCNNGQNERYYIYD